MGRKSTRENKTVYQIAREKQGLTLEKAGEMMDFISEDRIEKIESGSLQIQPEDVVAMADCYKAPVLCNYYCTHACAIGRRTRAAVEEKSFSQIAIETINALNRLNRWKDRLLEIVEDGQVRSDESEDFLEIRATLEKISASAEALRLWVDGQIAEGRLDREKYGNARIPQKTEK